MKKNISILFLLTSLIVSGQKKVIKKFQIELNTIEISTVGLDDFVLQNSTSQFIEIILIAENSEKQHIVYNEKNGLVNIKFNISEITSDETVFRKFITKRLKRASATIKIPQNKSVTIFGDNINIESKNYKGNLNIYIEKGILKLHTIQANTSVKFYAGNVFARLKNSNIRVRSNIGRISVDNKTQQETFYRKQSDSEINFTIVSIKGNVFLTNL